MLCVAILQVLKLEALLNSESHSCVRKVCLHDGVRVLVGDQWKSHGGRMCSCLHVSTIGFIYLNSN